MALIIKYIHISTYINVYWFVNVTYVNVYWLVYVYIYTEVQKRDKNKVIINAVVSEALNKITIIHNIKCKLLTFA